MAHAFVPFGLSVTRRDRSYDLWMAFFRDPDGNILALMSEVPTA